MKKYILIKEYPGSPSLGSVYESRNNESRFCYHHKGETNTVVLKDHVENQPEYWEDISSCHIQEKFFKYKEMEEDDLWNAMVTYEPRIDYESIRPRIDYESIIEEHRHNFNYLYEVNKTFVGFKDKLDKKERKALNAKLIWKKPHNK